MHLNLQEICKKSHQKLYIQNERAAQGSDCLLVFTIHNFLFYFSLSPISMYTHTHTHTYIYIYI